MTLIAHSKPGSKTTRRAAFFRGFVWGMAVTACATAVEGIVDHYSPPLLLRVFLTLFPLLPFVMLLKVGVRLLAEADELERQIAREAMGFALCGLAGLVLCIDLLRTVGVWPDFVWSFKWFVTALWLLLTLGATLSARRYR